MKTRRRRRFLIGCLILPVGLCLTCYGVNVLTFLFPYLEASNRWEATQPPAYTASCGIWQRCLGVMQHQ